MVAQRQSPPDSEAAARALDLQELTDEQVNRVFRALADTTRRDIVRRTLTAEASISELAADYDMSFAAVQKHVAVLEAADLVARIPRGRERIIRGNPEPIRRAQRLLGHFEQIWRGRIDRLDALLAEGPQAP
ncbi:helix-turn-helix transcriptional regulator [Leucobacter sp. wl10]|uniref:ArsR/SmtB family transcription factor n=1 Tax=Leucobacter sp. wl10 TaxID=2304677 RepID=UPI000E5C409C|nr:metalloregulator ArsR/SmtB family transcription factor [Leucobacter sp. wl10]RGE19810.1 ArsR family transcriptional regulator [Leucobacter sp. wl10]